MASDGIFAGWLRIAVKFLSRVLIGQSHRIALNPSDAGQIKLSSELYSVIKATHISTWDYSGGAAMAAYRLHRSLPRGRCESSMFVLRKSRNSESEILQFAKSPLLSKRILRRLRQIGLEISSKIYSVNRPEGLEKFTDERSGFYKEFIREIPEADVLHFHWTADFIQLSKVVRRIGGSVPLVFTLHDMNLFTGGCHYDLECGKFKTVCGQCPQLGSTRTSDRSFRNFKSKKLAFGELRNSDVKIVCPSKWMAKQAASSEILRHLDIDVIANGIDLSVFYRRDRDVARQIFEIPEGPQVILFVAQATENKRKGLDILSQSLLSLQNRRDLVLLTVGNGVPEDLPALPHVHLGSIYPESLMANIYSAADLFVAPYQQDNLPNTIIESMACGTPVVAFNIGGIPEIISDGENGVLVKERSPGAMASSLDQLLNSRSEIYRLSSACRPAVEKKFNAAEQGMRYLELYESILSAHRAKREEA